MTAETRRAGPDDLPALLPLVAAMHGEGGLGTDVRSEAALKALLRDPSHGFALVASRGSPTLSGYILVGFGYSIEFLGRDAFVDELYVPPAERGRGLGTALLRAAEEECRRLGIAALHLEADNGNGRASDLYRRLGFEHHPRHLMTKWLGTIRPGP